VSVTIGETALWRLVSYITPIRDATTLTVDAGSPKRFP